MGLFGGGGGEQSSSSVTYNLPQPLTGLEATGGDIWQQLQRYLLGSTGQDLQQVEHADEIAQLEKQLAGLRGPDGKLLDRGLAGQNRAINLRKRLTDLQNDFRIVDKPLSEAEQMNKQIQDELYGGSLQRLQAGLSGGINPEVRAEIDKIFGAQEDETFKTLQRRGIEASGIQGMNFGDTPIFQPFMRSMADAAIQREGLKAQALLDQNMQEWKKAQGLREFQESLNQQTIMNRFGTAAQAGAMANQRYGLRLGNPRRTATFQTAKTSGGSDLGGIGAILGGIGSLGKSVPSILGAFGGVPAPGFNANGSPLNLSGLRY